MARKHPLQWRFIRIPSVKTYKTLSLIDCLVLMMILMRVRDDGGGDCHDGRVEKGGDGGCDDNSGVDSSDNETE